MSFETPMLVNQELMKTRCLNQHLWNWMLHEELEARTGWKKKNRNGTKNAITVEKWVTFPLVVQIRKPT
jgi:hypothetical protein